MRSFSQDAAPLRNEMLKLLVDNLIRKAPEANAAKIHGIASTYEKTTWEASTSMEEYKLTIQKKLGILTRNPAEDHHIASPQLFAAALQKHLDSQGARQADTVVMSLHRQKRPRSNSPPPVGWHEGRVASEGGGTMWDRLSPYMWLRRELRALVSGQVGKPRRSGSMYSLAVACQCQCSSVPMLAPGTISSLRDVPHIICDIFPHSVGTSTFLMGCWDQSMHERRTVRTAHPAW